ncbi:hypothetical protein N7478_002126 [Penicillium angulare]|uniref:uncharacterized protein n=1 Tax=Penicillium angulare TaxID=116970 RepID=UPI00254147B6|nr:uncharacterized protein N7478_002126 [Penicillium angulare]KAJ5289096.1 hypothetical protein N7478_002126 [Penicillium angulare]
MAEHALSDPKNPTRATPNIKAEDAICQIGSSTFITAPPTKIWDALINTSTWPTWNKFIPRVTIVAQPNITSITTTSDDLSETPTTLSPILQNGTRMIFHVLMDPTSPKEKFTDTSLVVTKFEPPNSEAGSPGRIVWSSDFEAKDTFSPWLLTAEREHEIRAVEGGSEVRNWENQIGYLAYVVKWMYGSQLDFNFGLWIEGLKRFAEGDEGHDGEI